MLFNSLTFVVFFLAVFAGSLLLKGSLRRGWLLLASYTFYGFWSLNYLGLILFSTLVDYFCAQRIESAAAPERKRRFLGVSIAVNLGVLGIFKYFDFFSENAVSLAGRLGMELDPILLNLVLPAGISFYTFQTLSYTIDVYRGEIPASKRLLDFALFVAFFPQLVAGPIERAGHLLPQLEKPNRLTLSRLGEGAWLIFFGYFLKIFVADNVAKIVTVVLAPVAQPSGAEVLLAAYAFTFQIFGDFAGYSSIAIGLAKWLGVDLMTNFRFPYLVRSPREFWQHWHISLSSWFRDYLYIPLGGNRTTRPRVIRNLLITFLLSGLWHGAGWNFLCWGLIHGLAVSIQTGWRFLRPERAEPRRPWLLFLQRIAMFHFTCFTMLVFRVKSIGRLPGLLSALIHDFGPLNGPPLSYGRFLFFHLWLLAVLHLLQWKKQDVFAPIRLPVFVSAVLLILMFYSMAFFGESGGRNFIYFQF